MSSTSARTIITQRERRARQSDEPQRQDERRVNRVRQRQRGLKHTDEERQVQRRLNRVRRNEVTEEQRVLDLKRTILA